MEFMGKQPVLSDVVTDSHVPERFSNFQYMGCVIYFCYERDVSRKLPQFQAVFVYLKENVAQEDLTKITAEVL